MVPLSEIPIEPLNAAFNSGLPLGRVVSTSYDRVKQKVGRSGKPLNLRCAEVGSW